MRSLSNNRSSDRAVASSGASRRSVAVLGIAVSALTAVLAAMPAAGQIQFAFEFSFSNPGARSMGFGGAFVALADDATAAFANPAGLVLLNEPEVSVEGRSWSYSTPFVRSGRVSGQPTGIGLDTEAGLRRARSEEDLAGLSFLSFVYPKKRWSFALYRHQLATFEFVNDSRGIFGTGPNRVPDQRGATDLEIVTHGLSAAFRVTDNLSLGVGLAHFDGRLRQSSEAFLWDLDDPESFFAEIPFLPERRFFDATLATDDQSLGLVAGFLWRFAERWQLGGSFRQGPEFDGEFGILFGPAGPEPLRGTLITVPVPLAYPDVHGLGIAYHSADQRLTLSFEWDRVGYSVAWESIQEIARRDPRFGFPGRVDDADEVHFGAEYVFLGSSPLLAVRLGAWFDPDHGVREEPGQPALPSGGGDAVHLAVGFGAAFERFQIDVGADFSDLRDTVSVSAIYSF